jgi:hypothetical protein
LTYNSGLEAQNKYSVKITRGKGELFSHQRSALLFPCPEKLALFFVPINCIRFRDILYSKQKTMGQNKLNKKEENKSQANNNNAKSHKGDTGRSSDKGRKSASGGNKETNNKGQSKGA